MIGLLLAAFEIGAGVFGLYCVYRCMKRLRLVAGADSVAQVWQEYGWLSVWSVLACLALGLCAMLGGRALGVVLLAGLMTVLLISTGGMAAGLRIRKFRAEPVRDPEEDKTGLVEIRSLLKGCVRGSGVDGGPVLFDDEDIEGLRGVRGRVRMLNWATARSMSSTPGVEPLFAFWSEEGDQFLLYPGDDLAVVRR